LTGIDPGSIRSGLQDVHRMAQVLRRQLAAARVAAAADGERQRNRETVLGCTTRHGDFTRTTASAR
jgi:hypothetical protein